ncbi:MAG: ATP-dependent 6-phosphofructokinase [Bacteroidales bacterium]|jgi:6-phosphofructokinase 1|nr:ATP-dependent 6-phosphofructokinase [Bacteroidales bacterium]
MKRKVMVLTGGGDCPGLNAVIRAIVKRASQEDNWEVLGCIDSFNGVLKTPLELVTLDLNSVSGILVKGGTILGTTNKGGPFHYPIKNSDGSWSSIDRSEEMIKTIKDLGIEAVINIGGDGSQRISKALYDRGLNIIGVPKTIDNDLSATDFTFGFQTAVQTVTEDIDKLVTTASSHNRVFIMEVMGRDAGWIALHSAIAGGADVCIIPEMPYNIEKIKDKIEKRYINGRGFCIIVVAEGAYSQSKGKIYQESKEIGYYNEKLGGIGNILMNELIDAGVKHDIRLTVLGHVQRGGTPIAYDRILASEFGVKAFEMVLEKKFGQMVVYRHPEINSVSFDKAIKEPHLVEANSRLVKTAMGLGIEFGN